MATADLLQQEIPPASDAERALYPLSVEQYHRMIETGILPKYDKCELLEGILYSKLRISPRRAASLQLAAKHFDEICGERWVAFRCGGVALETSHPEPGLAIARGAIEDYCERYPQPADVALVVEVSETSLDFDRNRKGTIYAMARIPQYWIVNLVDRCIEVYLEPADGKYEARKVFAADDTIPVVLDGQDVGSIRAADIVC